MRFLLLAVFVAAGLTSGCATATRGTTEDVTFISDPAGAKMETTTGLQCITPCTLNVPRSDTFTATFKLEDEVREVFVDTEVPDDVAATTAANVLLTPIVAIPVAIAVDAASGANLNHTPNPVIVKFSGAANPEQAGTVAATVPGEAALTPSDANTPDGTGTAIAAIGPAVADPAAPKPVEVSLGVAFPEQTYNDCAVIPNGPGTAFPLDDLETWRPVTLTQDIGFRMEARIRTSAGRPILDLWPNAEDGDKDRIVSIPLASLDPGAAGRVFTQERIGVSPYQFCGDVIFHAQLLGASPAADPVPDGGTQRGLNR